MITTISSSPEDQQPDILNDDIFPLSQMIPGIVHNISNPLTIIKVRSQLLQNKMPESPVFPALLDNVAKIEDILGNLADRINNLNSNEIRPISLKNLINTEIKYLDADLNFKHKITKTIDMQESQPFIKASYLHLSTGLLATISALIKTMEPDNTHTLGISVTCLDEQILLKLTTSGPGLAAIEIPLFIELIGYPDFFSALKAAPTASPALRLLTRAFFCFRPYISDFSLSPHPGGEFECLISFPTGK